MQALDVTHWDVNRAAKYIRLKKLSSVGIASVQRCKEALVSCGWDVGKAADFLLESMPAQDRDLSRDPLRDSSIDPLRDSLTDHSRGPSKDRSTSPHAFSSSLTSSSSPLPFITSTSLSTLAHDSPVLDPSPSHSISRGEISEDTSISTSSRDQGICQTDDRILTSFNSLSVSSPSSSSSSVPVNTSESLAPNPSTSSLCLHNQRPPSPETVDV